MWRSSILIFREYSTATSLLAGWLASFRYHFYPCLFASSTFIFNFAQTLLVFKCYFMWNYVYFFTFHFPLEHLLSNCSATEVISCNAVCDSHFSSCWYFFSFLFYRLKSKFNMPFNIYITGIVPPSIQPPNISYASESHFWFSSFHISFRWIYGFVMAAKCTFIYCRCSVMLVWCVTVVAPSFTVDIPYLMFFFVIYTILLCVSCLSFLIFEFNIFLSFFFSSLLSSRCSM